MHYKYELSICIPTYNRVENLDQCIQSIISQRIMFSNKIEIVISDNCSTDGTEELCHRLIQKYDFIKYYRNDLNLGDINFPLCISRAEGKYRKLCNDSLILLPQSLEYILEMITKHSEEKPVLYFANNNAFENRNINSVEEFLKLNSYRITSISHFGIWADDFSYNTDMCQTNLWQVDILLKNVNTKKNAVVVGKKLFNTQDVQKKNLSYGLFRVFYYNFLDIVRNYTNSLQCVNALRKDLLFRFFLEWDVTLYNFESDRFIVSSENLSEQIEKEYKQEKYYFVYVLTRFFLLYLKKIKGKIIKI